MTRSSLREFRGLPDPFLTYNFDLIIPSAIPGVSIDGLRLRCQMAGLPGYQIEPVTVGGHGIELNYAGRQIYSKSFTAQLHETRDMVARKSIVAWIKAARDNESNRGNYKSVYGVDITLNLYDDIPNVVHAPKVLGVFPTDLAELQLDGTSSTAAQYSVTFSFDSLIE